MATERDYQNTLEKYAAALRILAESLGSGPITDPTQADAAVRGIDQLVEGWAAADAAMPAPPDGGLSQLAGVGPDAAPTLGDARMPQGVKPYDDEIQSERIV